MRIRYVAVAAFNALLLASLNSHAVGGGGGGIGGGGAPASGGRYPIGAPPSNDSTDAYAFRAKMSQDPPCQDLSQEADRVFMDGNLPMEAKANKLKQLEARAKQNKCIQSQSGY